MLATSTLMSSLTTQSSSTNNNKESSALVTQLSRLFFRLVFVCVLVLASLFPVHAVCRNRTLDTCRQNDDCTHSQRCLGRIPSTNEIAVCNKFISQCYCTPLTGYTSCTVNTDCPLGEACARSSRTGNTICVGCQTIANVSVRKLIPLKQQAAKNYCEKTPRRCARSLDFCSPSLPCGQGLNCVQVGRRGIVYECAREASECQCHILSPNLKTILTPGCKSNSECSGREICASDLSQGQTFATCTSCAYSKRNIFIAPVANSMEQSKKCQKFSLDLPNYPPGSNGLAFDKCDSDMQCIVPNKCMQFKNQAFPANGVNPCTDSSKSLCFCRRPLRPQGCQVTANCRLGEACVDADYIGVKKSCVSMAFLAISRRAQYTAYGKLPASLVATSRTGEVKATGETCRYDWQCESPRRCTHLADDEIYGGCAGRQACICKPLHLNICTKHWQCTHPKELCVVYKDSPVSSFCYSRLALAASKDLISTSARNAPTPQPTPPPGNGFTMDACRNNTHCVGSRLCTHIAEGRYGRCNNRRSCVCKLTPNKEATNTCTKSAQCVTQEVCVRYKQAFPRSGRCMSKTAFNADVGSTKVLEQFGPRP